MRKQADLVKSMIKKNPNMPARTMAKILMNKYPQYFLELDKTRSSIRYYLGLLGKTNRNCSPKELHRPKRKPGFGNNICEGIKQVPEALKITEPGKWLIISDVHIPYHDKPALTAAIEYGIKHGCKNILINGDWYDFYKLSNFSKDPLARDPSKELKTGRKALKWISDNFPGRKLFKAGNHEERYETYLRQRAPELAGDAHFALERYLRLKNLNFEFISGRRYVTLGKLPVLHGHEVIRSFAPPVNAARGLYLKLKESALCSHFHTRSMHTEQSGIAKHSVTCYSIGCLCDLSPAYSPFNSYTHGFAIVIIDKNGNFVVWNKQILNGVVTET